MGDASFFVAACKLFTGEHAAASTAVEAVINFLRFMRKLCLSD